MIEQMVRFSSRQISGIYTIERDDKLKKNPYSVFVTKNNWTGRNIVSNTDFVKDFPRLKDAMEYLANLFTED